MKSSIGLMIPLESANVLLKHRVRLQYQVPVAETLHFVYQFQHYERYYREIQRYVERMAESANGIFVHDIYQLTTLEVELMQGRYKITPRGKQLIHDRLQSTYQDGWGYHFHVNTLGQAEIKPIQAIHDSLVTSGQLALDAAHISQRIRDDIDGTVNASSIPT
jgi:hypothetical protein